MAGFLFIFILSDVFPKYLIFAIIILMFVSPEEIKFMTLVVCEEAGGKSSLSSSPCLHHKSDQNFTLPCTLQSPVLSFTSQYSPVPCTLHSAVEMSPDNFAVKWDLSMSVVNTL